MPTLQDEILQLSDPDWLARRGAAAALGRRAGPERPPAVEALWARWRQETSEDVQISLLDALQALCPTNDLRLLELQGQLGDKSHRVRQRAEQVTGRFSERGVSSAEVVRVLTGLPHAPPPVADLAARVLPAGDPLLLLLLHR